MERKERAKFKENKRIVKELLENYEREKEKEECILMETEDIQETSKLSEEIIKQQEIIRSQEEIIKQQEIIRSQEEHIKKFKDSAVESNAIIVQLNNQIENLKKTNLQIQETNEAQFLTKCKERFQPVLTPKQISLILGRSKRTVWDAEDLTRAFTLRYNSFKAYMYMKNTLQFPLPAISTLQKWAAKIEMKPGVLKDILKLMKIAGTKMDKFDRISVLSFDEVKVQEIYEYYKKYDQILGPHKNMQVRRMVSNISVILFIYFFISL